MRNVLNLKHLDHFDTQTMKRIDRATFWGNQFRIGDYHQVLQRVVTRNKAIELFEEWLLFGERERERLTRIEELRDYDLVCWCAPLGCHGHIYQRILYTPTDRDMRMLAEVAA